MSNSNFPENKAQSIRNVYGSKIQEGDRVRWGDAGLNYGRVISLVEPTQALIEVTQSFLDLKAGDQVKVQLMKPLPKGGNSGDGGFFRNELSYEPEWPPVPKVENT